MTIDIDTIITLAARVIAILFAGFILPKLRAYLSAKLSAEEWAALVKLITALVEAAEQTIKKDEDPTGKLRKQYVVSQLHELSYDITDQVDAMIEAAVYGINEAQHGDL